MIGKPEVMAIVVNLRAHLVVLFTLCSDAIAHFHDKRVWNAINAKQMFACKYNIHAGLGSIHN